MQAKCQIYSTQILYNKQTVCESAGQSQLPVLHCTGTASTSGSRPQKRQAEASAIVIAEIKYILIFTCISEQVWFFGCFFFFAFFFFKYSRSASQILLQNRGDKEPNHPWNFHMVVSGHLVSNPMEAWFAYFTWLVTGSHHPLHHFYLSWTGDCAGIMLWDIWPCDTGCTGTSQLSHQSCEKKGSQGMEDGMSLLVTNSARVCHMWCKRPRETIEHL